MNIRSATVVVVLVCVAVLFGHSSQAQPCTGTSDITRETYPSRIGQQMYYTVYTPPCEYSADTVYPVIYLMHGSNENDEHWLRLGLRDTLDAAIKVGDLPPVVVVMPFGNVIANRNRFDSQSWGRIFVDELMPHAEATYPIATTQEKRAIGGVSRGGFWAYQIAFQHPQMFHAVGGHSAFFDPYHAPPEFNPLDLAQSQTGIDDLRLWLDYGADDFAAPGLQTMHERLSEQHIDHMYQVYPQGQHTNAYWSSHLREYLDFYTVDWQQDDPEPTLTALPAAFATNTPFPAPEKTPSAVESDGVYALFPVASFPSLQTSVSMQTLEAVAAGERVESLVLSSSIKADLETAGIAVHEQTRVTDNPLVQALWQDRGAFTLLPMSALTPRLRMLWVDDVPVVDQLQSYPFVFESLPPNYDPDQLTRITLSGVTALARNTRRALTEKGTAWAASGIRDYAQRSDYFHMSSEVSFVEGCPQPASGDLLGGSSSFCARPDHGGLFTRLGVDIVELTGNHNNDYGYAPYEMTLDYFHQQGIMTVGGGQTLAAARDALELEHLGNDVVMLACNAAGPYYALVNEDPDALGGVRPGAAACDWTWLEATLPQLARQASTVIVTVQYPELEQYVPTEQQQFDFRRLANLGADIVMGTSAHKPQTYEFYETIQGESAFIHYGMGNLFFDQPFWGNRRFFMNTVYVYDGRVRTVELFPGIIDDLARPRLMTLDERTNFLFFMLVEKNGF